MDFDIKKGELEVSFTQDEMDRLASASGDPVAFRGAVDEIVDTNRLSDDCCRPALYRRLPHEALHAVWQSQQVEVSALSPEETHLLGVLVGLAMFGPQTLAGQSHSEVA
jgi:hypothetical protein